MRRATIGLWMLLVFGTGPASLPAQEGRPSGALREVIATYWNDFLKRHPLEATLYVGDHRYDDRMNDASPAAYQYWLSKLRETRDALLAIDPKSLAPAEQVDRDVLLGMIDDRLALEKFGEHLTPLVQVVRASTDVHTDDLHLLVSQLGELHPANTAGDVENLTRRLASFPRLVHGLIATLKQGVAEKRVPPKLVAQRVLTQLRSLASPPIEKHPIWSYTDRFPVDWPEDRRIAASQKVRDAIRENVLPAYEKLATFVEKEYLPACREGVGLCDQPDGQEHYALLARHYTTTDIPVEQIHQTGLAEVAKIRKEMDAIRKKVGFEGDLAAFLAHVRADPKLKNRDEKSVLEGHRAIVKAMQGKLPLLFGRLPATPVEVWPFDPVRAKSAPTGEYLPPPIDGGRPGVFYVNTSNPTERPTYTMQALAYHEAVPGHHLQIALSHETPGAPAFRRYFYLPAFDEGWALYSEALPAEVGLYTDPYAEFGRLNFDAHRSVRLVIDTGIHAKGWSREKAIAYFEQNTSLPRNEIETEVDRYIAWPGQALAYKIGALAIRAAREKAQKAEGASFDLRAFHDRLLASGSIPLRVMERVAVKPGS